MPARRRRHPKMPKKYRRAGLSLPRPAARNRRKPLMGVGLRKATLTGFEPVLPA